MDSRLFRTLIAALALACAARIVTSAQGNPEAAKVKNPVASSPESIAAGKVVYAKCASCHGINGEGGPGNDLIPAAPSLVDDMWDHGSTDGEIFDNIKNGVRAGLQHGSVEGSVEGRPDLERRELRPVDREEEINKSQTPNSQLPSRFDLGVGSWRLGVDRARITSRADPGEPGTSPACSWSPCRLPCGTARASRPSCRAPCPSSRRSGLSMRPSMPFAKKPIGYGTRNVRNLPSTSASSPSERLPVAIGTSLPTPSRSKRSTKS